MNVGNDRTGVGSRSGGTATKCSADPQSIPAACGLIRSRTDGDTRGCRNWIDGMVFHRRLLYTRRPEPPGTGMRWWSNLLNGITPASGVSPVTMPRRPRATLTYGLTAPVAGRPRFPEVRDCTHRHAPVSRVTSRDRIAWAVACAHRRYGPGRTPARDARDVPVLHARSAGQF